MTESQWNAFCSFRTNYKNYCNALNTKYREVLFPLQKEASKKDTPEYPLETAVVYNTALDEITRESQINMIVIGDNPGKDEQLAKNRKYLVGQSGKIAAGFFRKNPELKTDFRTNAIILNKTPVHTAKTSHLKYLCKAGGIELVNLINETQAHMARITAELQQALGCEIWLVGYAELKSRGIFDLYRNELKESYTGFPQDWEKVLVFQHFSMNRFLIDLRAFMQNHPELSLSDSIHALGTLHRQEIFGS